MNPGFFSQASHSVLEEVVDASRRCGSGGGCGNRREADTNFRLLLQARHFDGPAAFRSGRVQLVADMMEVFLREMYGDDRLVYLARVYVESEIKKLPVRLLTADANLGYPILSEAAKACDRKGQHNSQSLECPSTTVDSSGREDGQMSANGPTVSMHKRLKADFCALMLKASVLSGRTPEIYVPLHHLHSPYLTS